jgi:hypothetical protein
MALNLIDLLEQLLGSNEVVSRIGALIGLSPEKAKAAIGTAVPAILAGLVGTAQKPEGRNRLAAVVRNQDSGLLDDLAGALGGGREQSLIESGGEALGSLFDRSQVDGLAGAIGKASGLSQSSANSLLGALTPMVMGALGREQRTQGLDAQGLAGLLNDQTDNIARALPTGLAGTLGSTGLLEGIADRFGGATSTVARVGRTTAAEAARTTAAAAATAAGVAGSAATASRRGGGSMVRWVVGIVVVLAVLWAAYQFLFRSDAVQEAADQAADTAAQVGEAAQSLMVGDVDVGQEVTNLFDGATEALEGVTDAASAETAAGKLSELDAGLDKLGGLVEQLPGEGKSALAALVAAALPDLEALVAKASEIPGVGDAIKPVTDSVLEKLRAMTA